MTTSITETEAIATNVLPYDETIREENKKAAYLAKRICGFTIRESVKLTGIHERTLRYWRETDPKFVQLDGAGMIQLRQTLAAQYLDIEFSRNLHLVLERDFKVLWKMVEGEELSKFEQDYVLKLRSHYTPQSLAMVKQLLAGGTVEQPFDFTKLTLTIRRESEQITVERQA